MKHTGLSTAEAEQLLQKYGPNTITREKKISRFKIFLEQISSPIFLLLFALSLFLFVLHFTSGGEHMLDAILIMFITVLSAWAGYIQEYKAEKSIEAIKKMSSPMAEVMRDGKLCTLPHASLVPGDIIILDAGDIVPGDASILETTHLLVDEAMLTGESEAIEKKKGGTIFMNTLILGGNCTAKIESTGKQTRIGEIAISLENIEEETSLFQQELAHFSRKVLKGILGISVLTFFIGMLKYSLEDSLVSSIALSVAAIPEGLPAILTLSLALSGKIMAKKNTVVRKLGIIETMGSVTTICTDKTGTLTKNDMEVVRYVDGLTPFRIHETRHTPTFELLAGCYYNNSLKIVDGSFMGDQTERAMAIFAEPLLQDTSMTKKDELPFDAERKAMSVIMQNKDHTYQFVKGSLEYIIENSVYIQDKGKVRKMTPKDKDTIFQTNMEYAQKSMRVLGLGYKIVSHEDTTFNETHLIYAGMVAIKDPLREDVQEAISICAFAGIEVYMLTGDHPLTAQAIAKEAGIPHKEIITGSEFAELSDVEIIKKLQTCRVFARLAPEHKLTITRILKSQGKIVAMTGDGVNDAPALKNAHVGVAMGIRGTEVSKQASDIVIMDDNFATIVQAIKEGRRIYDNIRKFIQYLFTSNLAEVGVIFIGTLFFALKDPILLPMQLLWINLLTDGLPSIALGMDTARPDIMSEKPRPYKQELLEPMILRRIYVISLQKMIAMLAIFFLALPHGEAVARTALFTGFVCYESIVILMIRFHDHLHFFSNPTLIGSIFLSFGAHLLLLYTPLAPFFHVAFLTPEVWLIILSITAIGFVVGISTLQFLGNAGTKNDTNVLLDEAVHQ